MLHSDGAIANLLPDIIALGVDVIHPLEPLPATDLTAVKEKFGKQVSFLGGIDISHAMPGSREDVIAEAKRRIAQLAPGGGYILAPPTICRQMSRRKMLLRFSNQPVNLENIRFKFRRSKNLMTTEGQLHPSLFHCRPAQPCSSLPPDLP
jgi:hypothetical protein